ncbi:VirB8/TrbF family protein [uncultured Thiodictyon sp.]|uniref:VirB8/TrbF family protein n=1 Tax=uncultured Thiodictyon sp. TaxID=1846217 RepID=UPI0025E1282F|nr:VirB8/TrbF family protein [uncultured Thiodictyon sp.]
MKWNLLLRRRGGPIAPGREDIDRDPDAADELDPTPPTAAPDTDNPYLNARRVWNEHEGAIIDARQAWQMVAMLSLLIALAAVGGMIYLGSQSQFIPYVVEVDKLGQALAVAPAQRAAPVDERVLHATVAQFIADARLVTLDTALQRKAILRNFALLAPKDPAMAKMTQWVNGTEDSSPFLRAEKEMVSTDITSVLPQTPDTWQVDWVETTRNRDGGIKDAPVRMRALVTVYTVAARADTTEEQIRNNPLGIYVRDFSWSRQN